MNRSTIHITLVLMLSLSAIAQVPGGLLYDMGIVIRDSTAQDSLQAVNADTLSETDALILELERYQEELAVTTLRLRHQTQVIDSLKAVIERVEQSRQTDLALLNTRLEQLTAEDETVGEPRMRASDPNAVLDSVYAELTTDDGDVQHRIVERPREPVVELTDDLARKFYRLGIHKFHQQYYYAAIEEFTKVTRGAPDAEMQGNAQYWIGRSYFEKGLYPEAIVALEKLRHFPDSDKLDDALVLIGLAFQHQNELEQAKVAFRELVDRHPESEYLTLARRFVKN